jgi:lactam utilization protein B
VKRLAVLTLALLVSCAPTAPSDPNADNAAFAQALCAQDEPAAWAVIADSARDEFENIASAYSTTAEEVFADGFSTGDGYICKKATYAASYTDEQAHAASVYIFTYEGPDGEFGLFYVFTSDETGVLGIQ